MIKNNFIHRIHEGYLYMQRVRDRKRFLIISFEDDGIRCKRMYYDSSTKIAQEIPGFFLKGITEKNIRNNKKLRAFLFTIFLPFPYKICVLIPHHLGGSYYEVLVMERNKKDDPITREELDIFFSQNLGKDIEANKKDVMHRTGLDDLDALMVSNRVTSIQIDNAYISIREHKDAPLAMTGKTVSFGIIQTFFHRGVFGSLQRLLPRRAKLHSFFQDGFPIPLSLVRHTIQQETKKTKEKTYALALIRERGTNVFLCSTRAISFYDSISIGYQSIYEVLNTRLGVDVESFWHILHSVSSYTASPHIIKQINSILSQEIHRIQNGLQSVKKETKVNSILIDPGRMGEYINAHTVMKHALISKDEINFFDDITIYATHDSLRMIATIACILRLPRKHTINHIATKHVRWLLPHAVEKV